MISNDKENIEQEKKNKQNLGKKLSDLDSTYNSFCTRPFEEIEININRNVYTCCPSWNNYYAIGNINSDNVEKIWNSEKAVTLREKILNNDYSLCIKDRCYVMGGGREEGFAKHYNIEYKPKMDYGPKHIKLCYDYECNSACIICRDKVEKLKKSELKQLNDKIDTFFIPLLKHAELLTINTAGDAFGSRHSLELIKKAAKTYPNLKFDFTTNGILCTEKMFNYIGLDSSKINTIRVSVHAATKKTYAQMVQNGENLFDIVIRNLKYLSELKHQNGFKFLLNFVVTSLNYKDMPQFIKLAQELDAYPVFWEYKKDCCTNTKYRKDLAVVEPSHKEYKKLIKVLHHPNMYIFKDNLYPILKNLQDKNM